MEQTVLQVGTLDLDMVGQLEAALEGARRDAAMQELSVLVGGLFLALHRQCLFLDLDVDLELAEAGDRHGDPVLVVAEALDVIGRISGRRRCRSRKRRRAADQPVEANGRTIQGGKIEVSHHRFS